MKTFPALAALALSLLSPLAMAEDSPIFATLTAVTCKSIFEGDETTRVTSKSVRGHEGYNVSMTLSVDRVFPSKTYQQSFKVSSNPQATRFDSRKNSYVISGRASNGDALRLEIDGNGRDAEDFAPATSYVNGRAQDYLKLVCKAPLAG